LVLAGLQAGPDAKVRDAVARGQLWLWRAAGSFNSTDLDVNS